MVYGVTDLQISIVQMLPRDETVECFLEAEGEAGSLKERKLRKLFFLKKMKKTLLSPLSLQ